MKTYTITRGAVLITVWEKPASDIDVYWSGKETAV
jgi:hypothetical protein